MSVAVDEKTGKVLGQVVREPFWLPDDTKAITILTKAGTVTIAAEGIKVVST